MVGMEHTTNSGIIEEIRQERQRQNEKWGEQNHPDHQPLSYSAEHISRAAHIKRTVDLASKAGTSDWSGILLEEVAEAIDEAVNGDVAALRKELVQVAAVAIQWIEAIDRREQ